VRAPLELVDGNRRDGRCGANCNGRHQLVNGTVTSSMGAAGLMGAVLCSMGAIGSIGAFGSMGAVGSTGALGLMGAIGIGSMAALG